MAAEVISLDDWRRAKALKDQARARDDDEGQSAEWLDAWAEYYRDKALTRWSAATANEERCEGADPMTGALAFT